MSGSGNHDNQPNHALGGKIKDEVLSTLKLLFKNAEQHSVSVLLEPTLTIYPTDIASQSVDVPLESPTVEVSQDPIAVLRDRETPVINANLIHEAQLAETSPCHIEPTLCHEPVYDEMAFESFGITFNNIDMTQSQAWPVEPLQTQSIQQNMDKIPKPAVQAKVGQPITAQVSKLSGELRKATLKSDPRFYALPIRKMAIPPHRFSLEAREAFRKVLAEKNKTHPANVQLKMVFERMHMAVYSSIQPDELGLLCVPKSELLGRNREAPAAQALLNQQANLGAAMYLAIGIRLDNKEDIRTLVPVETILNATPSGGEFRP